MTLQPDVSESQASEVLVKPSVASGLMGVCVSGVGAFVPENIITNDDLTKLVDTSDEWISSRTGIRARHVVSGDETIAHLAIGAAKDALLSAGLPGEAIDLVIVASSTPDTIYPNVCCQVQHAIGATRAAGFDLALACSGFVYATIVAQQFIRTGMYQHVLIVAADIHSRYMDWYDRNTCVLFGDGAGAMILSADPEADRMLGCDLQVDGSKGMELTLFTNTENCPLVKPKSATSPYVHMNGREVFKFAVGVVPRSIKKAAAQANVTVQDLDYLILHQANIRIMQAMSEKLEIPETKLITNLDHYGNTSAASIPIAINEAVLSGKIQPNQLLGICGFGAGMAWATTIFKWTAVDKRLGKQAFEEICSDSTQGQAAIKKQEQAV